MGYTTEFEGRFYADREIEPKLVEYINRFSKVRHMKRDVEIIKKNYPNWRELCFRNRLGVEGEYFLSPIGTFGDKNTDDILDYNEPPKTQPGLWCQWIIPEDDHSAIEWDGGEKFYCYTEWLYYIIKNFLEPNGYFINGTVSYQGEDDSDFGKIVIENNKIKVLYD